MRIIKYNKGNNKSNVSSGTTYNITEQLAQQENIANTVATNIAANVQTSLQEEIAQKVDTETVYTKTEVDDLLDSYVGVNTITAIENNQSGGNNTVTVTLTDGTTTTFNVKNGEDGVSLGEIGLVQTIGDNTDKVMSQKAVSDTVGKNIKICQCVHFGLTTTNYFNLTNEQVSVLNNTDVISIRFVAQTKGDASAPWRYFVLCGTSHYSSDTTTGFYLKYDYSKRLFASGVNYNTTDCLNKLSNGTIINPAVHTIVWNKATGTIKFYERNNLVSTQQNNTWKLTNFINTTVNRITLYSGDNDTLLYDLQVYDGDISELFTYNQGSTKKEEMVTAGASYVNAFYDGNLQTYHGQQVNSKVSDYASGSGFTVVAARNSPDGYKHVKSTSSVTTGNYSASGYYVGITNKAAYWESDVEVVSGEVIFTKHNSNIAPITIIDSNNNELSDGSTVGVGEYTLKGVGATVGKWQLRYVSGEVDVIHKADRVKYISCVVHIKGNVIIGKSLYDEQANTYYTVDNIAPDGTPFDQVVLSIVNPPVFLGQRAVTSSGIYMANSSYTWVKVN